MFGNLGNMKALGSLAGLMQNKEKVKDAADRAAASIAAVRATGEAGGGAVRAIATGRLRIESIELEPPLAAGLAQEGSREYAQSLIAEAVNNALEQAEHGVRSIVQEEARSLGLDELLGDAIDDFGKPGGGMSSIGKLLG